jgi:hypothetical protein
MEELHRRAEDKEFFAFADAIGRKVHDVGKSRGATARSAQDVIEVLFEMVDGDASKVTDVKIVSAFDKIGNQ